MDDIYGRERRIKYFSMLSNIRHAAKSSRGSRAGTMTPRSYYMSQRSLAMSQVIMSILKLFSSFFLMDTVHSYLVIDTLVSDFTFGATPANLLLASMAIFYHASSRCGVARIRLQTLLLSARCADN